MQIQIADNILLAGSIGLIPETMSLQQGLKLQAAQSFENLDKVLEVIACSSISKSCFGKFILLIDLDINVFIPNTIDICTAIDRIDNSQKDLKYTLF